MLLLVNNLKVANADVKKLPLVFSGGVMSNALIKNMLCRKYNAHFAEPQFSADNACGTAVLASICDARK